MGSCTVRHTSACRTDYGSTVTVGIKKAESTEVKLTGTEAVGIKWLRYRCRPFVSAL